MGHIVKTIGIGPWAYADHAGLRLWQANHMLSVREKFTPAQAKEMANWEDSGAANWARATLYYDLSRSWRFTPGVFVGDSGSANFTNKAPSMVTMVNER
eukprot:6028474-Lingulodinium_polyedra.AAC.1